MQSLYNYNLTISFIAGLLYYIALNRFLDFYTHDKRLDEPSDNRTSRDIEPIYDEMKIKKIGWSLVSFNISLIVSVYLYLYHNNVELSIGLTFGSVLVTVAELTRRTRFAFSTFSREFSQFTILQIVTYLLIGFTNVINTVCVYILPHFLANLVSIFVRHLLGVFLCLVYVEELFSSNHSDTSNYYKFTFIIACTTIFVCMILYYFFI